MQNLKKPAGMKILQMFIMIWYILQLLKHC